MHKYTRVARGLEGVKIICMIDLVLVKKDVRALRGMGRSLSDHHLVLCEVRLVGTWIKRKEMVVRARRIRSEKLRQHQYRE